MKYLIRYIAGNRNEKMIKTAIVKQLLLASALFCTKRCVSVPMAQQQVNVESGGLIKGVTGAVKTRHKA